MKITLLSPRKPVIDGHRENWDAEFISFMLGKKIYNCAYLALPTIAALTPPDVEIKIVDENIEDIDFDMDTDLVGITTPTFLAPRAYEIAEEFRKRDVTVVLGGIHPSMLPDEAITHADVLVTGEAEGVWGELINDYKKGRLKQFYQCLEKPDLSELPIPRWDLLKNDLYNIHSLQTTRGCPYDCEFCSVKAFLGNKYRCKPIDKIIEEVKTLIGLSRKRIFFTDDNFIGNKKRAKELLKVLGSFKISYYIQASLDLAKDEELLKLLAQTGCNGIFIGFESVSETAIKQMNKAFSNKVPDYLESVRKIQSYGMGIQSSFIFGYDSDDISIFKKTVDFIQSAGLEMATFHILTPFPGTKLYERLNNEGRILHRDWGKYDGSYVCYKPTLMSAEALQNGMIWAKQKVYSYENIFERLKGIWTLWNQHSVRFEDRISPIIRNLSCNDRAYSYAPAVDPYEFEDKNT
ncbi:MAG: B12-binding domain-containing radical SAM protein [Candidatus Omnitrophica bacterium]|nr:B12-binding domain-containing radical SAM protein [Candidatus Omnitrophota bacterium]